MWILIGHPYDAASVSGGNLTASHMNKSDNSQPELASDVFPLHQQLSDGQPTQELNEMSLKTACGVPSKRPILVPASPDKSTDSWTRIRPSLN